jgi:hypothetical protein
VQAFSSNLHENEDPAYVICRRGELSLDAFSECKSTVNCGLVVRLIQVNAKATGAIIVFVAVILGTSWRRHRDRWSVRAKAILSDMERTVKEQAKLSSSRLSRRCLVGNAAFAAGGIAVFSTMISRRAEAKAAQKLVGYQDTPHGQQQCHNCSQFDPPSSCKVVDGTISPTGWCKVYVKKPSS